VNPVGFSVLFSLFALIISIFSFFYFRSYLKQRTSQERILSELQEEVNFILKSINEVTERDITLIEEREKELKSLLEEIGKRLKTYIKEVDQARNAEELYKELGKNRYAINKQLASRSAEAEKAADREKTAKADAAFPLPDFNLKTEPEPSASIKKERTIREQVQSLLRSGLSEATIALRLGISIAEVEFAAALLERSGSIAGSVE
jgi:preprotein translocase subunit YajC